MSRLNPIWTAGRLNEALAEADESTFLHLSPNGKIDRRKPNDVRSIAPGDQRCRVLLTQLAEIPNEVDNAFRSLPAQLVLLAVDPEPWCRTLIGPGACASVGPFLDFVKPLWEWLVRAARAGRVYVTSDSQLPPLGPSLRLSDPPFEGQALPFPELTHADGRAAPAWLRKTIDDFDLSHVCEVRSTEDATAVLAGLLELQGFGDTSHELAQSVEGRGRNRAGDYWHAIHHRREPDAGNAKYWFRRVGRHPIHPALVRVAGTLTAELERAEGGSAGVLFGTGNWDSFGFVDLCDRATKNRSPKLLAVAKKLQFVEMMLLLLRTYEDATTDAASRS
ncbi:MAG TPA: hypothetical protein VGP63_08065 [Planctomycetaceae bacterium]|jgi:hypothetical protein|nr:hypothetical protein [Planctomycetaceae bacterium]